MAGAGGASLPPKGSSRTQKGRFPSKIALRLKKVCYKVSLCENCQRQSCKAFIGLSVRKLLVGDVPLNVALSKLLLGAAAVFFTNCDEYSICIAIITMEYQIINDGH